MNLYLLRLVGLLILSLFALGACSTASGGQVDSVENPLDGTAPVLEDLSGVDEFKIMFNDDTGTPRLLLLMSPT